MPLQKQPVNINFAKGLDLKSDAFQVQVGNFLSLGNAIFTKAGLLQKRNGFGPLTALPDSTYSFATTFNGNLTAIGSNLAAYSAGSATWVARGSFQPVELDTLPLIRSNTNQSTCDAAVTAGNIVCTAYTDQDPSNLSAKIYRYAVADSVTGQNLLPPATLTATGAPRVFLLGTQFVVVYPNTTSLLFITININTFAVTAPVTLSSTFTSNGAFDGFVANSRLYVAWDYSTTPAVKMTYITTSLTSPTAVSFAGRAATQMSVTADQTNPTPIIWAAFFDAVTHDGYAFAVDQNLVTVLAPSQIISHIHAGGTPTPMAVNITCVAQNNLLTFLYQQLNTYSYDGALRSDYIVKNTLTLAGSLGTAVNLLRSVGLGSKAFLLGGKIYFLCAFGSVSQPTYFLSDSLGNLCLKLAYSNGGGYYGSVLPSANVVGTSISIAYLFKDLVASINKDRINPSPAIYSQTGINLSAITLTNEGISTAEIGSDLHFTGGFLWMYDGYTPVEHNFHLFPDDVEVVGAPASGGIVTAQKYFYSITYEWSDNQGNIFRSAPSIPVSYTILTAPANFTANITNGSPDLTSASSTTNLQVGQALSGVGIPANTFILSIVGSTVTMTNNATAGTGGSITITPQTVSAINVNIPTIRLTYKIANPVKLVVYRSSVAQPVFYQATSISAPILNNLAVDSLTFTDILPDTDIIGNNILYTTGGVVENIGAPAASAVTLFKSRLFLIDAEDKNLLWFSKQVIEAVPVEMSDLFTLYIAPTVSSEGSTGPMRALAALDDKLIIFKRDAIYYITGTGPDNTGANNDFSEPIFVTSTVGCSNQRSIAFIPEGLMFQSDKGIWLLGRDLSTKYIGAPVEAYNANRVLSAVTVPGTNQVRFTLDNGVTLMYDYFYGQWGTFNGIPAVSSTLYQGLHTYINAQGKVFQETPGQYLDGSSPTLLSLTTSWLNLAGLQGYERAYFFYLLGTYLSPHKLTVQIAYDYNASPTQTTIVSPENFSGTYGLEPGAYGADSPYGGSGQLEQWRVFLQKQTCQSFQITITETFDSFFGTAAGAGLTLSGLDIIVGLKRAYRPIRAANSVG